jgi:hypothetical protein
VAAREKRTKRWELVLTPREREALADAARRTRRSEASIVREGLDVVLDRYREYRPPYER